MTLEATRKSMQGNKSKNTLPEQKVKKYLRKAGLSGYRIHWNVPGKPDIAYPGSKIAIFVNGCFWHDCPKCKPQHPKSNQEYWEPKLAHNKERDKINHRLLAEDGWHIIVIWECQLSKECYARTMNNVENEIRKYKHSAKRTPPD